MKKYLSLCLTVILILSMFGTTAFGQDSNVDRFMEEVQKTNDQINLEIQKAIDDADDLTERYQNEMDDIMGDINNQDIFDHEKAIRDTLNTLSTFYKGSEEIKKRVSAFNEKLNKVEDRVVSAAKIVDTMNEELQRLPVGSSEYRSLLDKINLSTIKLKVKTFIANERAELLTKMFLASLDRIINHLIETTNKMAEHLVNEGKLYGIEVYCEWVEVTIGGKVVLVDPCRVRGF